MVLFVRRKDQRVQHFAAGDSRIIAQVRVDQPRAIFQLRKRGQYKTYGFHPIENPATKTNDAIYQFTTFTYLRSGIGGRINGDILDLIGAFDISIAANVYIFQYTAVLDNRSIANGAIISSAYIKFFLCKFFEPVKQLIIFP